jgi:hypothetical protein
MTTHGSVQLCSKNFETFHNSTAHFHLMNDVVFNGLSLGIKFSFISLGVRAELPGKNIISYLPLYIVSF